MDCPYTILTIIIAIVVVVIRYYPDPRQMSGVYREKGKFFRFKWLVMYIVLRLRKRKELLYEQADIRQPLSIHQFAIDAVNFNGVSKNGTILAIATAQRKSALVNGFCILRIPEFKNANLVMTKFPDTCLYQSKEEAEDMTAYRAEGIRITPIEAIKSWRVEFIGEMKVEGEDGGIGKKTYQVKIDAIWKAKTLPFNYDVDISASCMARALALEPWSREYFKTVEHLHQTHFEQYGSVDGNVSIDGVDYPLHTDSFRDHSFGHLRDWKLFHRYVIHMLHLENGDRISVGIISMPATFSRLEIGFYAVASKMKNYAISSCDLELWRHGEQGEPPLDYAFEFWANCKRYICQVKVTSRPIFYMGTEAEAKIIEQFCDVNVNGIKGWGVAECQYRHLDGLPGRGETKN